MGREAKGNGPKAGGPFSVAAGFLSGGRSFSTGATLLLLRWQYEYPQRESGRNTGVMAPGSRSLT